MVRQIVQYIYGWSFCEKCYIFFTTDCHHHLLTYVYCPYAHHFMPCQSSRGYAAKLTNWNKNATPRALHIFVLSPTFEYTGFAQKMTTILIVDLVYSKVCQRQKRRVVAFLFQFVSLAAYLLDD